MADEKRVERDSDTPVSKEMKEQQVSGRKGLGGSEGQASGQPPQGSGRVHDAGPPPEKRELEEGHAPSEQGDGSPGPEQIKERLQGLDARRGSRGGRGTTEATKE